MTEFQAGQKIRATSDTRTWGGVDVPKGTVVAVVAVQSTGWYDGGIVSDGFDVVAKMPGVDHQVLVNPDHFTDATLDPSKVKVGDTVTVRAPASQNRGTVDVSASITGVVLAIDSKFIRLHGVAGYHKIENVTAHQPAPEPDYRGQFVTVRPDVNEGAEWFGFIDNEGDFFGMEDGFLRCAATGDYTVVRALAVS